MTKTEAKRFLAQFAKARRAVAKLRRQYPACFDAQGRPIVAVAAFPKVGGAKE